MPDEAGVPCEVGPGRPQSREQRRAKSAASAVVLAAPVEAGTESLSLRTCGAERATVSLDDVAAGPEAVDASAAELLDAVTDGLAAGVVPAGRIFVVALQARADGACV